MKANTRRGANNDYAERVETTVRFKKKTDVPFVHTRPYLHKAYVTSAFFIL